MKYILTHYQGDLDWVKEYTDDVLIYNRSETEIPGSIKRENVGDADYDRLTYIVDNYNNLPDVFLLAKSNLFKYIKKHEFDKVKDNTDFTPLLTKDHQEIRYDGTPEYIQRHGINRDVSYYSQGIYWELNNSWYVNEMDVKYCRSYAEFAKYMLLPNPMYLPFAPGGNYILTRERVHRYGVDFYNAMRELLPYARRPAEAQMCERSYYTIWS